MIFCKFGTDYYFENIDIIYINKLILDEIILK